MRRRRRDVHARPAPMAMTKPVATGVPGRLRRQALMDDRRGTARKVILIREISNSPKSWVGDVERENLR